MNQTIRRTRANPFALRRLKTLRWVAKATMQQGPWTRLCDFDTLTRSTQMRCRWLIENHYLRIDTWSLLDGREMRGVTLTALGRYALETGRL